MQRARGLVLGDGRAVSVLSLTQILCWGILIYPPVLIMPVLTADRGWSLTFGMAGFFIGLVPSGMLAPRVGHLIDRHGGNIVMSAGALAGALGLVLLTIAEQRPAYLACWLLLGAAMSSPLYDPAFATLTRIFGTSARRQITFVTFAGGFASTVGWPATQLLLEEVGWRGTDLPLSPGVGLGAAPPPRLWWLLRRCIPLPCRARLRSRRCPPHQARPLSPRRRCGPKAGHSSCW